MNHLKFQILQVSSFSQVLKHPVCVERSSYLCLQRAVWPHRCWQASQPPVRCLTGGHRMVSAATSIPVSWSLHTKRRGEERRRCEDMSEMVNCCTWKLVKPQKQRKPRLCLSFITTEVRLLPFNACQRKHVKQTYCTKKLSHNWQLIKWSCHLFWLLFNPTLSQSFRFTC